MAAIGPGWDVDAWVKEGWDADAWGGPADTAEERADIRVLFVSNYRTRSRRRRRSKKKKRRVLMLRDSKGKFLLKADQDRFVELTKRMRNKFGQFTPNQLKKAA